MQDKFVKLTKKTEHEEIVIWALKRGEIIVYIQSGEVVKYSEKQAHEAGFCVKELD